VTELWSRKIRFGFPAGEVTGCGPTGDRGLFLGVNRPGRETTQLHLAPIFRMSGAITLRPTPTLCRYNINFRWNAFSELKCVLMYRPAVAAVTEMAHARTHTAIWPLSQIWRTHAHTLPYGCCHRGGARTHTHYHMAAMNSNISGRVGLITVLVMYGFAPHKGLRYNTD
jgi:hypothetical protein